MTVTIPLPQDITPPDRAYWVMPEMIPLDKNGWPKVRYTVDQVARFFFARSGSWLRLKMHVNDEHPETYFVQNGKKMVFPRKGSYGQAAARRKTADRSARFFTLAHIEPMAQSLFSFGIIDERRLRLAIGLLKLEAELHGIKVEADPPDDQE